MKNISLGEESREFLVHLRRDAIDLTTELDELMSFFTNVTHTREGWEKFFKDTLWHIDRMKHLVNRAWDAFEDMCDGVETNPEVDYDDVEQVAPE